MAKSSEFCKCIRLACEYVYLVSSDYGKLSWGPTVIERLEKLLVNPEPQVAELSHLIRFYLTDLKYPSTWFREKIEHEIAKATDETVRAEKSFFNIFFGSAQKQSEIASRVLKRQEERLARFVELESQMLTCRTVLDSFVEQCNKQQTETKKYLLAMRRHQERHQKNIEFEQLHGIAYAKAATLDGKTRRRASSNKNKLEVTEKCPYCDHPLGHSPHADHIYPVSRGGLSTIENMVYCCQTCNSLKADKGLIEFLMAQNLDIDVVYETLRSMGKRI